MKHPEFELGGRRLIPALPEADPQLGPITWGRWEEVPCMTHIPGHCTTCEFPGPLRSAQGMTWHQDPPRRALVRRSRVAEGQRPVWGPVTVPEPRLVYTHWATRCPHCDEMSVWRTGRRLEDWVEIHYHPYTVERVKPEDGMLF